MLRFVEFETNYLQPAWYLKHFNRLTFSYNLLKVYFFQSTLICSKHFRSTFLITILGTTFLKDKLLLKQLSYTKVNLIFLIDSFNLFMERSLLSWILLQFWPLNLFHHVSYNQLCFQTNSLYNIDFLFKPK